MERPQKAEDSVETMGLDAGSLCLNLANTSNWHASDEPTELLKDYGCLVTWGRRTGSVSEAEARQLLAEARRQPEAATVALARAVELREAIYRIFSDLAEGREAQPPDIAVLNGALATAMARARIVVTPTGFDWGWDEGPDLERVLWPAARSAADLLSSEDRHRVGQCADERGCGWLFLDMSRNHSRRWCDMNDCGNRAKARRHYRRQRDAKE